MLYALYDLVAKDHFKPGSKILAIHSGGIFVGDEGQILGIFHRRL
jgi:1-aminocyclopropane-1-carboxylate deaminase/D-cysteine desulfhydrase-like pyridoxal-dependent ACC family enzyme